MRSGPAPEGRECRDATVGSGRSPRVLLYNVDQAYRGHKIYSVTLHPFIRVTPPRYGGTAAQGQSRGGKRTQPGARE